MFKLKSSVAISLLRRWAFAAGMLVAAGAALPVAAQSYQVANSTSGRQVAAALIDIGALQQGIYNAQNTANSANNQAFYATAVGNNAQTAAGNAQSTANNAQSAANWAADVANDGRNIATNARDIANSMAGRTERLYELGVANCAMNMGGQQWTAFCEQMNPRRW